MMPAILSAFLIMVAAALFALDVGRGVTLSQKMQTALDAVALSSARIKAKGLESAAQAWTEVGANVVSADNQMATIASTKWTLFETKAANVVHALPGYKGRVRAVIGVVSDANRLPAGSVQIQGDGALSLGLSAPAQKVRDEKGKQKSVVGVWLKRDWAPLDRLGSPPDGLVLTTEITPAFISPAFLRGAPAVWRVKRRSMARVRWKANLDSPTVVSQANGGFPRTWGEAVQNGQLRPHRYAYFSGENDVP